MVKNINLCNYDRVCCDYLFRSWLWQAHRDIFRKLELALSNEYRYRGCGGEVLWNIDKFRPFRKEVDTVIRTYLKLLYGNPFDHLDEIKMRFSGLVIPFYRYVRILKFYKNNIPTIYTIENMAYCVPLSDKSIYRFLAQFGILRKDFGIKKDNWKGGYQGFLKDLDKYPYRLKEWFELHQHCFNWELGKIFGVREEIIRKYRNGYKLSPANVLIDGEDYDNHPYKLKEWWAIYFDNGVADREFADIFGVDKGVISDWRVKFGYKRKHYSEMTEKEQERFKEEAKKRSEKLLNDPEWLEKCTRAAKNGYIPRPTTPERIFDKLTPDSIMYVGDRKFWISWDGMKHNPDFRVKNKKKVVEIFGDYWHKDDNPEDFIKAYRRAGYDCKVFWEHEVYEEPGRVLTETLEFIRQ